MFSIIGAILAIGLLIIVHEAGHYFVARWCKMRVDRFSIGFGPPIVNWKRGETNFSLGPILFGGFVQINGMTLVDEIDPDDERQYPNRPVWQRFATIFAGPATNYLAAIVIGIFLYTFGGVPSGTSWFVVSDFSDNNVSNMQKGDKILKVGDALLYASYEGKAQKGIFAHVQDSKGSEMTFTVLRDGKEVSITATPKWGKAEGRDGKEIEAYLLGIVPSIEDERVEVGVLAATGHAFEYPIRQTQALGSVLYDIITGKEKGELSGPVGIVSGVKTQFDRGWIAVLGFLMFLNVNLGLFNLLPLPALDGGRLIFLVYEMTTRRRPNPKIESTVHMVGIMALLLVMVLVTYKDIAKLF